MTIDDFDLNEISNRLATGDEVHIGPLLEAAHDDGHQDAVTINHNDLTQPAWHDDASSTTHNDGHYDVIGFDDAHVDFGCPDNEIVC